MLNLKRLLSTASSVVLRPYQEKCIEECLHNLKAGVLRFGVSLPTGSGKTTVFTSLISQIMPRSATASRALVIVNSVELAIQAARHAESMCPELSVEIEQGAKHQASGDADITVATYQTLLQPQRLAKFDPHGMKAVIVDEAHHAAAPSYRKILAHFNSGVTHPEQDHKFLQDMQGEDGDSAYPPETPIIGFSATFSRHDGLALGSVFERIVYHRDFLEMIKENWLCDVRFTTLQAKIDLQNVTVSSKTGDFNATSLAHVVNTDTINELVFRTWLDKAAKRKSTLIFCVSLAHIRDLTEVFRDANIDARYIYGGTPTAERCNLISSFKERQFPVLLNCAVLTEGADIPNIDCVMVARPTRSRNVFAQMIGRGMRLSPETGKEDCLIIDMVDSLERVTGVVSTPSLFGLDPREIVDDVSLKDLEERAQDSVEECENSSYVSDVPAPTSVSYVEHHDMASLFAHSFASPHVMRVSRLAWVGCGGDVYILECLGKGHIKVKPRKQDEANEAEGPLHRYEAVFVPSNPLAGVPGLFKNHVPFFRNRSIATASTIEEAIKAADTYAVQKVCPGIMSTSLRRSAEWRKRQASPNQQELVGKLMKNSAKSGGYDPSQLTKGEAADLLARLKHGAKGRLAKAEKVARSLAKAEQKEKSRRARETVKVGPLPTAN